MQDASSRKFTSVTKELYDTGNRHCPIQGLSGALPELYTEGFDDEQVWQQLELHNESAFRILMKNTAKLLSVKGNRLSFKQTDQSDDAAVNEQEEDEQASDGEEKDDDDSVASDLSFQIPADSDDEDESDDDDDFDDLNFDEYKVLDEDGGEKGKKTQKDVPKFKKTEVDDQFFKLREMEAFLQKEESKKKDDTGDNDDDDDDEDSVDLFDEIPSEDEEQVTTRTHQSTA